MPIEPPASPWRLTQVDATPGEDLVAVGADLESGTLLQGYRHGLFAMGLGPAGAGPVGWWSPDPRGVLLPGDLHVSRSLRRVLPHFEVSVDTAFATVLQHCADPRRPGCWITPALASAYLQLHRLGWAHSIEVRRSSVLVGGLFGVAVGGLFAGESMFHHADNASKVALVALVERLEEHSAGSPWMLDVQWCTPHLARMGVHQVSRERYLHHLDQATLGRSRWP